MGVEEHEALVVRIREWFGLRAGHPMSVTSHMGSTSTIVAEGPFLGLEAHPTAEGVYRALFDDSLTHGSAAAPAYVAFGSEVRSVEASSDTLVLDTGYQTIEIIDRGSATRPRSDEVSWPEAESGVAVAPPPMYPPPPPAPGAPLPPEPADEDAFWSTGEAERPAYAPESVAPRVPPPPAPPSAPPPAYAPPTPVPMYAAPAAAAPQPSGHGLDLQVAAPLYSNCFDSRFFGPVALHIEEAWMTLRGQRTPESLRPAANLLVGGTMLLVFGGLALALGIAAFAYDASAGSPITQAVLFGGLLLAVPGLVMRLVAAPRLRQGPVETVRFPLPATGDRRVRYDSNLGCLLMLLVTPIVGLIAMLVMGRRIARISAPIGPAGKVSIVMLKTRSSADGAILDGTLRGY